jgi:hypothetical protein
MNENPDDFPDWINSPQKAELDELPVTLSDFERWLGVIVGGEYFMINVSWIIREVWNDCILSRISQPVKNSTIARAVCYEVMARACERLAYSCLPEPVRKDIDNEMGKNHRAEADKMIRTRVAAIFLEKAEAYWNDLDLELKQKDIEDQKATSETYFYPEKRESGIIIHGWSNSAIPAGFIALFKQLCDGIKTDEIRSGTIDFHIKTGLFNNLSMNRKAGFLEMLSNLKL